ncbi:putative integral membrane protein [Theileria parva strain Muguga]|uniref:putative integral membrane protein n=1 Tax=Theileria parva strain Muguga TaxID=333668 RepID=UPI001C6184CA|nr:putative integral membrane protein [Theileria parva strain Muguga]EAN33349.2 putative integral membrane protein [Theileria parva strain Muguga]
MGAYLLTLGENYPRRFANAILNDLIKLVLSSGYENDSPVLGLQSTLQEKLKDIFYKYDSVVEKDHVTLIKVKAEHAKNHIKESMFHVLESTANVELLRDTSEVLKGKAIEAFEASKNASKVYARPRNIVIIVSVVLGIAAIVAIALIIYFCTKKS